MNWKKASSDQRRRLIDNVSRWRKDKIRKLKELHGGKCKICGYSKCFRALEFHHIDPAQKLFGICSEGRTIGWTRLVAEAQKCVLLCANCHREIEEGLIGPAFAVTSETLELSCGTNQHR